MGSSRRPAHRSRLAAPTHQPKQSPAGVLRRLDGARSGGAAAGASSSSSGGGGRRRRFAAQASATAGAQRLTITAPDDWHLHVRDGDNMRSVVPHSAAHFRRAIIMPNTVPPVTTTDLVRGR
jgi:hypothetical protein